MRQTHVHRFEHDLPLPTSPRTIAIARHFGVLDAVVPPSRTRRITTTGPTPARTQAVAPSPSPIEVPAAGEVMLLCGASGSGKSSLLRALLARAADERTDYRVIDLHRLQLPERPIVDLFDADRPAGAFAPILRRLARVGLAEVWTWLRTPSQLSDGQRWRLRLALAMHLIERDRRNAQHTLIVCDEFAALLDRITADVVASVLRRFVNTHHESVAAIVATSHDDLVEPLDPDHVIECDFGSNTHRRRRRTSAATTNGGGLNP